MAPLFFQWTQKNTGEVDVTAIKCNFSAGKHIIRPPIPFLHIPIIFGKIEYGFNIKGCMNFSNEIIKSIFQAGDVLKWELTWHRLSAEMSWLPGMITLKH